MAERRRGDGQGPFWGDQVGKNPTDRGKNGSKKSLIVEADGGPLGAVVAAANTHDTKLLRQTIEAIVVQRPKPNSWNMQHLCLDKGYDNPTGKAAVEKHRYVPHIRRIGEDAKARKHKKSKPRRWVVERTLGWLSKCRALLVRYDKNGFNHLGLIQLACALLWYRRAHRLGAG